MHTGKLGDHHGVWKRESCKYTGSDLSIGLCGLPGVRWVVLCLVDTTDCLSEWPACDLTAAGSVTVDGSLTR
jgi:hypothetical protein